MGVQEAELSLPEPWKIKHLSCAISIMFIIHNLTIPCLCAVGNAKMVFAMTIDLLFILRIVAAYFLKESGRGWIFYAWLIWTSPLWFELIFIFFFKHH